MVGWLVVVGVVGGDDGVDEVVVDDDDDDDDDDVVVVCVVDFKSTGFNPSIKVNQVDFFNTSDILHKLCVRLHWCLDLISDCSINAYQPSTLDYNTIQYNTIQHNTDTIQGNDTIQQQNKYKHDATPMRRNINTIQYNQYQYNQTNAILHQYNTIQPIQPNHCKV